MSSVTVLQDDNHAPPQEVHQIRKGKGKVVMMRSSAQRRKLADISNVNREEETHQQQFSSKDYAEKLQKENMTLMKALAHRNKIIELSGVEFQKLKISLRKVQENNLQLAQANTHMLAELNASKDRLKLLQHELGCKNVLLGVKRTQLEEQEPSCTHHPSKDKVPSNVSDGDCKPFQGLDMNHKDTKRKRTSRIKSSESSIVKPIQVKESANSRRSSFVCRKVSSVIDTTVIPEVTCQTEDDVEKGVVSQGENQIVDNIINKKFVAANPVKDSLHSKRLSVRRKSTRFAVQETQQTETPIVMDNAKETKEMARLSLRRRSARLRPEEAEVPCKSFHERGEVRETTKRRRVSSRQQQSTMFDFQEPEVMETLNADDAGLVSQGSRSEAVEPSISSHETQNINGKRRVSTRFQSTKGISQTASDTNGAVTDPSLSINMVQECDLLPSTVSQGDHERESKNKPRAEEAEGITRRTSVGRRPSRHAAEKVQSYREVSLKVKMRRNF
ncbi:SHUGOSHIN 2 isoform X3 [Raphanus sativus]|uniref:SHUGOSHIN 2 isoform X3 n=1 Tax=Raphanus sativus TaxID=3726 RepID=A0A9W3DCI7_RAPSA|nr:SHUGOSHIN 2 isoform X3 [Raphanus sativus]